MAVRAADLRRRPAVVYRRILVPLVADEESETAVALAAELADDSGSRITAVVVVEVPPALPLDAHMLEEEAAARRILDDAREIAAARGVRIRTQVVRTREAGEAIVAAAEEAEADLIVLHARRTPRLGRTVRHVLHHAPCRVLLAAPSP